jgi:hypothetical protein
MYLAALDPQMPAPTTATFTDFPALGSSLAKKSGTPA